MNLVTTISRVTRNSPNAEVLREQCRHALAQGGYFAVTEVFTDDAWYTEFTIAVPVETEDAQ